MAKLFDVDGKEVEAFTADELESKKQEAVKEYMVKNPDKSAEFAKLQTDLDTAKKALEESGKGGNDQQKARLKEAKDAAELALKEVTEKLSGEINSLKETFTSGTKNKAMAAVTKGDKDLEAKIDLKYKSLMKTGDYPQTEDGVKQAIAEAATIVTGKSVAPNFMDNMSGAGDRGAPQGEQNKKPETENSKAMRTAFGISDKTAEKYSGVDATKPAGQA